MGIVAGGRDGRVQYMKVTGPGSAGMGGGQDRSPGSRGPGESGESDGEGPVPTEESADSEVARVSSQQQVCSLSDKFPTHSLYISSHWIYLYL